LVNYKINEKALKNKPFLDKPFTGTPFPKEHYLKPPTPLFKKEIDVTKHKRRKPNGKNKVVPVKRYTYYK
jgi:hypothetical protein